jgi:MFS family permease
MTRLAGRLSDVGLALAIAALLIGFTHCWFGPVEPPPPVEQVVAEKIVGAGQAIWARLRHEESPRPFAREQWGPDRSIKFAASLLGVLAVALAAIGFARRERKRTCIAAGVLGLVGALSPVVGFLALVGLVFLVLSLFPIS